LSILNCILLACPPSQLLTSNIMKRSLKTLEFLFLALYITRSFTDILFKDLFYLSSIRISLSALHVTLMIGVAIIYLFLLFLTDGLWIDKIGWIFLTWVLFLSPWVIISTKNFGLSGLTGIREWIRLLSLILFFFTIIQIASRRSYRLVVNTTILGLTIPLVTSYHQLIFQIGNSNSDLSRTLGTMSHGSTFAYSMVIMIGLTIWKFSQSKRKIRYLWGTLLIFEIPPLITSAALGGWVMTLILFLTILLLSVDVGVKRKLATLMIFTAIILIIASFIYSDVALQFQELWNLEGNPAERLRKWSVYASIWQKKPVFGYGLNTSDFIRVTRTNKYVNDPHNDYLRYLTECGIFGLLVFIAFLSAGLKRLITLLKSERLNTTIRRLFLISIGLYSGWIVISFTDNVITMTVFQIYFWGTLAAAIGGHKDQVATQDRNN